MVIFAQFQYPLKFLFVVEISAWYVCAGCKWLFDSSGDRSLIFIDSCWVTLCGHWVTLGTHSTAHLSKPSWQLIVAELWLHIIPVAHYVVDGLLLLARSLAPNVLVDIRRIWSAYHLFHLSTISLTNLLIISSTTHHSAHGITSTCSSSTTSIHFVLELLGKPLAILLLKIGLVEHSLVFC